MDMHIDVDHIHQSHWYDIQEFDVTQETNPVEYEKHENM
jgi:hypothetical protein